MKTLYASLLRAGARCMCDKCRSAIAYLLHPGFLARRLTLMLMSASGCTIWVSLFSLHFIKRASSHIPPHQQRTPPFRANMRSWFFFHTILYTCDKPRRLMCWSKNENVMAIESLIKGEHKQNWNVIILHFPGHYGLRMLHKVAFAMEALMARNRNLPHSILSRIWRWDRPLGCFVYTVVYCSWKVQEILGQGMNSYFEIFLQLFKGTTTAWAGRMVELIKRLKNKSIPAGATRYSGLHADDRPLATASICCNTVLSEHKVTSFFVLYSLVQLPSCNQEYKHWFCISKCQF